MYCRKLLLSALKYESGKSDNIEKICKTLHEMGKTESPYRSEGQAFDFAYGAPSNEDAIKVLNALGYGLSIPKTE